MRDHNDLAVPLGNIWDGACSKAGKYFVQNVELQRWLDHADGVRTRGISISEIVNRKGGIALRCSMVNPRVFPFECRARRVHAAPVFLIFVRVDNTVVGS